MKENEHDGADNHIIMALGLNGEGGDFGAWRSGGRSLCLGIFDSSSISISINDRIEHRLSIMLSEDLRNS